MKEKLYISNLVIIVIVFSACQLPFPVHSLVSLYENIPKGKQNEVFRIVWHCLIYGNSLVNPLILHQMTFTRVLNLLYLCAKFRKKRFYSETTNIRHSALEESKEVDLQYVVGSINIEMIRYGCVEYLLSKYQLLQTNYTWKFEPLISKHPAKKQQT